MLNEVRVEPQINRIGALIRERSVPPSPTSFLYLSLSRTATSSEERACEEKVVIHKLGRKVSNLPTVILEFPGYRTPRNKFLLFKLQSLWYFIVRAQLDYYNHKAITPIDQYQCKNPQDTSIKPNLTCYKYFSLYQIGLSQECKVSSIPKTLLISHISVIKYESYLIILMNTKKKKN